MESNDIGTLLSDAESTHAGSLAFPDHQAAPYQQVSALQPDALVALPSSDMVNIPTVTLVVRSKNWATKEDWVAHQPLIKQLYYDQKKPLKEVIRFMEGQHGFRATVKMYKTHITQWGLDKKNKEFEMRAIVRKNKQRAEQGKHSIIHVRGQLRDFREVVRYWDRKGISIDDIIARETASPTPEAVQVSTPVPSPITMPQVLAIPEQVLRCIEVYFTGSFESGVWVRTEPKFFCYSIKETDDRAVLMDDFRQDCCLACSLLEKGLIHEAGKTLSIATSRIEQILLTDDPLGLLDLLILLFKIRLWKRSEIALIILRQFSAMGQVVLGSEHPLSRVTEWLNWAFTSNYDHLVMRCVESMTDHFARFIGPQHRSTMYSRLKLIEDCFHNGNSRIQMMQNLLEECENALQPYDIRTFSVRQDLAYALYNEGQYAEAESLSQQNIRYVRSGSTDIESYCEAGDLYMVAMCQYALGKVDLGIATLHEAIKSSMSEWGEQDSQARGFLVRLEEWYGEQGLWGSAAQVRERRLKILDSMDVD